MTTNVKPMYDPRKVNDAHLVHKAGDLISLTKYMKINSVSGNFPGKNSVLNVTDLHTGGKYDIIGEELHRACLSADEYTEIEKVTKTKLAELLVTSWGKPFTVVFEKLDGSERTLRGRLLSSESLFGRSTVEDMDIKDENKRVRQVTHDGLKSIIIDGILYTLK